MSRLSNPPRPSAPAVPAPVENRLLGIICAIVTVTIWASWVVATRYAVTTRFTAVDIGLIRFVVPFLVLAPVWLKRGIWPRGLPVIPGLLIVGGSGVTYSLVVATALKFAPASHVGTLLPGIMSIWAVLIGVAVFGEKPGLIRWVGYGVIAVGIAILTALQPGEADQASVIIGYVLLVGAALMWACYTHALRRSGLTAIDAAAFTGFWSFVSFAVIALFTGTTIADAPINDLLVQLLFQGVLSGVVAVVTYGIAVRNIGSTGAAAFGALTPAFAALGGVFLLGELGSISLILAVALVIAGVMIASGVASKLLRR
ncbi:DMT family transporter [Thalassospira sp. MCCC 1A01428]|uniref:DMT family transporter n=1 Tax=Thalassospira sp. MCCC 1A01428 TaxID=1470575 RepID=UPI000A1F63BB|nr:DMT family transporter [Thalassospira sp. MCCC 1A01428]OSQ44436.1 transporter [Thalassospira sp. MCCC 1A01428]